METYWLKKHSNERCILFMNGWGCDFHPFEKLLSKSYDVLVCYDYRNISQNKEINRIFENYEEVHLVAWSLGVYISNMILKNRENLFASTIAINGTLHPIDNIKGIPPAIFQATINQMNEVNLGKFWKRMCGGNEAYYNFLQQKPQRNIENQREELEELQNIIQNHFMDWNLFENALVGGCDLIFSPDNQLRSWGTDTKVILKDDFPHYCLNRWNSWDDLIEEFKSEDTKN